MVCVAAFIILCLVSVFVGFLSIFNKALGKKYWTVFQKAWHCVFKKVRLQKCDTNFKDDVKNTLLKRLVVKNPKLLKPASALIEILSVLIVFITVWSIVISIKSLLALWVFGTCNVSQPSQCGLGSESCSIDQSEPTDLVGKLGRSFSEWGEIFSAIPDRLKTWEAKDYLTSSSIPLLNLQKESEQITKTKNTENLLRFYYNKTTPNTTKVAVNFVDPGCVVCMQSYRNQKQSGFLDQYFTVATLYAIPKPDGGYKYANSKLISDYLNFLTSFIKKQLQEKYQGILSENQDGQSENLTSKLQNLDRKKLAELETLLRLPSKILDRLYAESKDNRNYIDFFNYSYDQEAALNELDSWVKDFGLSKSYRKLLVDQTKQQIQKQQPETASDREIKTLVEEKIKAKGIPVEIYDQKKHNGLFKI